MKNDWKSLWEDLKMAGFMFAVNFTPVLIVIFLMMIAGTFFLGAMTAGALFLG